MAEKKDDIEVVEAKTNKTTKLLVIIIAVLFLAVVGLGVFMLMASGDKDSVDAEATSNSVKQPPIYFAIEDPFIVNFSEQSNGAVRYIQIKIKVMARSQAVIDGVQAHLPAIQHELLMLFYSQKYDELQTSEGSQALQQASLATINQILKSEMSLEDELEAVYFTSFIMQ